MLRGTPLRASKKPSGMSEIPDPRVRRTKAGSSVRTVEKKGDQTEQTNRDPTTGSHSQEEKLQDESRKPEEDAPEEPANEAAEGGKASEDRLKAISVVQQNAVIVTGRRTTGDRSTREKPRSERWL